jgi:hypothetical protein
MKDVYQNATVCIAATAAANGNVGMFYERDARMVSPILAELFCPPMTGSNVAPHLAPCGLYWIRGQQLASQLIDNAPLNTRAWVRVTISTVCPLS